MFYFWHKYFILDDVKLAELSNNFWMKKCDILGVKIYFDPLLHFQVVRIPNPKIYAYGSKYKPDIALR